MDGRMQKHQPVYEVGDKVLWHDLVCTVSFVCDDGILSREITGDKLGLDVNGRTYYDYACNVEKLDT